MNNRDMFGIETFGFDLTSGNESFDESILENTNKVSDDYNENEQMDQILALCDANESLDSQYAIGLVNGLESISDTYRLILMSQATTMMDAGVESEDIGYLLNAAGLDVSDIDAGIEAREGGLVSPLRKAGQWVSGTKAYKAVADSWVGKGAAAIIKRIKQFLNWLGECIFGKAAKSVDNTMAQIESLTKDKNDSQAKYDELKKKYDDMAKDLESMKQSNNSEKTEEAQKISDEKFNKMKAVLEAEIKAEKETTAKLNVLLDEANTKYSMKKSEVMSLKNELETKNKILGDQSFNIENLKRALFQRAADVCASYAEVKALKEATAKVTKAAAEAVTQANTQQLTELNKLTTTAAKTKQEFISTVGKVEKLFKKAKTQGKKSGHGRPLKYTGRRPGLASEDYEIPSIFMMSGVESLDEMFDIDLSNEIDYEESTESPYIDIALAKFDMILAIEAGNESLNLEHFGHPYIGLDYNNHIIYGVTPGIEAEAEDLGQAATDAGKDEKKDAKTEEKKDDDKKGGFKESLSKAGKWVKNSPHYAAVQFRRFIKWLMSKSVILDRMLTKLATLFSRNVNIKDFVTPETKDRVISIVANFTYAIKKATYDLNSATIENFNGAEPVEKEIVDSVTEKLSKLETINSSHTASGLDKLGLGEAAKELRILRKKLSEKNLDKLVKSKKITAEQQKDFTKTMSELNRSSAKLSSLLNGAVRRIRKTSNKKDDKAEEKKTEETK